MRTNIGIPLLFLALLADGALAQAKQLLPLDPLTPEEIRAAERVTRADTTVRQLLGSGRSVLGAVYFLAAKPESDGAQPEMRDPSPQRTAMVLYYVYDGNYGVRALVDLGKARVEQVDRVENEPIPFAESEVAEARRLASADTSLQRQLKPPGAKQGPAYRVDWLGITATEQRDPCYQHRCLQLLFRSGRAYLVEPVVIVDLTAQQVRLEKP